MMKFKHSITTIDAHAAGEPLRIVTSGLPRLPGKTILEKSRYMRENLDHLRSFLMLEPRGHSGMYGCIITPPVTPDADFGVIFLHNEGYSTMCGHGIIAVTKVVLEAGMIEVREGENVIRIDSPAGRVTAMARVANGEVVDVGFDNVLSFVHARDVLVDVDELGEVGVDIAFGGAFYVYVDAFRLGVEIRPENMDRLVRLGRELKQKVMDRFEVTHPTDSGLGGIYGTIICDPVERDGQTLTSRNVCIFADAQIDRSPTGTGTSGRLALMYEEGLIEPGWEFINRSIIDTSFWGRVVEERSENGLAGVLTRVGGTAQIMGFNHLVLEPDDPLPAGFRITGG